jgi:hypothetical protein
VKSSELRRKTPLARGSGPRRRSQLGHCTPAQRERVRGLACIVCGRHADSCHPAHVIDRGMVGIEAADDVRAVVPLCPGPGGCHRAYDEGRLDLSPYLEPWWRDSQEWAAGAIGLFRAARRISGQRSIPESDEEAA